MEKNEIIDLLMRCIRASRNCVYAPTSDKPLEGYFVDVDRMIKALEAERVEKDCCYYNPDCPVCPAKKCGADMHSVAGAGATRANEKPCEVHRGKRVCPALMPNDHDKGLHACGNEEPCRLHDRGMICGESRFTSEETIDICRNIKPCPLHDKEQGK